MFAVGLQTLMTEREEMEEKFKTVSRTAQGLVKASQQHEVNTMLAQLKAIKERLVKIKKDLSQKPQVLQQVLPQVNSILL